VTELSPQVLEREARIFTASLIGGAPSPYVIRQYARGHVSLPLAPVQGFDAVLMRVARGGPILARLADAYARLFARRAILRRKLTLLLAILESTAPSDERFAPIVAPVPVALARLMLAGLGAAFFAALGVAVLGPLHIVSRLAAGRV
jgi:hypothetical protein